MGGGASLGHPSSIIASGFILCLSVGPMNRMALPEGLRSHVGIVWSNGLPSILPKFVRVSDLAMVPLLRWCKKSFPAASRGLCKQILYSMSHKCHTVYLTCLF